METTSVELSVALCTYNGARYIGELLESIVHQTVPPGEIVARDDGSTDDTLAIVSEYAARYPAIRWDVVRNEERLGVRRNFEEAIRRTSGRYIALADQDDVWEPDKLEVLLRHMREKRVALAHSDVSLVDREGRPIPAAGTGLPRERTLDDYVLGANNVIGCTCLFDSALKAYAFPFPRYYFYHDQWLAIFACRHGGISREDRALVRYRLHGDNVVGLLGEGKRDAMSRKYFVGKARDLWLLARRRPELGYSFRVYVRLLWQCFTCYSGLAYLKYRLRSR